jgi:hypothetical protein
MNLKYNKKRMLKICLKEDRLHSQPPPIYPKPKADIFVVEYRGVEKWNRGLLASRRKSF